MGYNEYKAILKALTVNIDEYTFAYDREPQNETEYIADMTNKANKVIAVCETAMRHPYADNNQITRLSECERAMRECITALRNGETRFEKVAGAISRFTNKFNN